MKIGWRGTHTHMHTCTNTRRHTHTHTHVTNRCARHHTFGSDTGHIVLTTPSALVVLSSWRGVAFVMAFPHKHRINCCCGSVLHVDLYKTTGILAMVTSPSRYEHLQRVTKTHFKVSIFNVMSSDYTRSPLYTVHWLRWYSFPSWRWHDQNYYYFLPNTQTHI